MELGHQHGEAVAHEGDALPARMGHLGGDGGRKPRGHRGQVPGQIELPAASDVEVPRCPRGYRSRVAGEDGIVVGDPIDHPHQVLGLDRLAFRAFQCSHVLIPFLLGFLRPLQEAATLVASKVRA